MSGPAHNILGSLPVPKLVWTMSAPIMLSMLMSAIYNLVDSIYVAQVSELDFLALSYAYPVQLMMVAFCAGTGVGFNALFAQRLGAGQKEEANRVACHGFLFYGLCWLLFLAFALLGAPLFFRLSTDNAAVAAAGTSYLVICCGLSIGMCMQFLTERLLQTTGHPAGFMIVQGSGAILNIILDPVFIFGLDMGMVGAAAATVIGQISGACIGFFLLWRIRGGVFCLLPGLPAGPCPLCGAAPHRSPRRGDAVPVQLYVPWPQSAAHPLVGHRRLCAGGLF